MSYSAGKSKSGEARRGMMHNGYLTQFLDTGWYCEATLYYNGYIYWLEGYTKRETDISRFFINRWRATKTDDMLYHTVCDANGKWVDFKTVFEAEVEYAEGMESLKKMFLEAKVFDGKTFWEVEKDLYWLDEGDPVFESEIDLS